MIRRRFGALALLGLGAWGPSARGDQFEQVDGPMIARLARGGDVASRARLTIGEIGAMPALLRDSRSALALATTDRGNPARLLLVPELRKPADGRGEPIPVLVLERLDAFDASEPARRIASRREVVLFDGLPVDLDSGQVVPEGQGGDLVFRAGGEGGPRLETLGEARLYTLTKPPALDDARVPRPTPGRSVVAGDFAGRYRLFANGQWSGTLDLKVEPRGVVTGRFRSDLHGSTYPVTGQVATDEAQKVRFSVAFPRARQEFDGYLWGEGKGAMAGTVGLLERTYGFFALREGGRFAPEGADVGPGEAAEGDRPGRHVVEIRPRGADPEILLDGRPAPIDGLAAALKAIAEAADGPEPWVAIRAPDDCPYSQVVRAIEAARSAGIATVRLGPAGPR